MSLKYSKFNGTHLAFYNLLYFKRVLLEHQMGGYSIDDCYSALLVFEITLSDSIFTKKSGNILFKTATSQSDGHLYLNDISII